MAAIPMLRRNVKLEIPQTAICGGLARQLHIPNNFTFAQPEKAIGHESQIEPWLALTTPLLDASETDERRYASKMNLENRKNRGSSLCVRFLRNYGRNDNSPETACAFWLSCVASVPLNSCRLCPHAYRTPPNLPPIPAVVSGNRQHSFHLGSVEAGDRSAEREWTLP